MLDALLQWTLLNTDVRKLVETVVGEISHSELADMPDKKKVIGRLAAMNALARMSWKPELELWKEAETRRDSVSNVLVRDKVDGEIFPMYYVKESMAAPGAGRDMIIELLSDPQYVCVEENKADISRGLITKHCGTLTYMRVKRLAGETLLVPVTREMTVEQLKIKIQDMEGIPRDQQILFASGRQLADSMHLRVLLDMGFDLDPIHLLMNLRGC